MPFEVGSDWSHRLGHPEGGEAEDQLQISLNSTGNTLRLVAHLVFKLVRILALCHGWCSSVDPGRPAKAPCQSTEHRRIIRNHRSLPGKSVYGLKCQNNYYFTTLVLSPLLLRHQLPTIYFASSTQTEFHRTCRL